MFVSVSDLTFSPRLLHRLLDCRHVSNTDCILILQSHGIGKKTLKTFCFRRHKVLVPDFLSGYCILIDGKEDD